MSDYSIPSSTPLRPRSVAASRTRGLRSVAFGVALMLLAQTWVGSQRGAEAAADAPHAASSTATDPAATTPTPVDRAPKAAERR